MKRIAIVGAGISGLATAWKLRQAGAEVTVFDPSPKAGGVMQSVRKDGYLLELGPNTVMEKGGALAELIDGAGLRDQVLPPLPQAKRRYIYHRGKPVAAPSGPGSFITSPLLGCGAKLRLLSEPFRSPGTAGDESIAAFFSRRLGPEAVDRLIEPFVSGVFAGDAVRLSARHSFPLMWKWERTAGSLVRGALKGRSGPRVKARMLSFRDGLETLPLRLAELLSSRLRRERVESLARGQGGWRVNNGEVFDAVVCAIPPSSLVPLLEKQTAPGSLDFLESYPHSNVRVWHFGVEREQVGHPLDGFGVLAPPSEEQPILGILFSSSIFQGRAPEGCALLTVFQGGVTHPEYCRREPGKEEEARGASWAAVRQWLDVRGEPAMVHHQLWSPAIPQYEVGHQTRLDALDALEAALPGLYLRGNLRGGVSVSDCVASAFRTAGEILGPS